MTDETQDLVSSRRRWGGWISVLLVLVGGAVDYAFIAFVLLPNLQFAMDRSAAAGLIGTVIGTISVIDIGLGVAAARVFKASLDEQVFGLGRAGTILFLDKLHAKLDAYDPGTRSRAVLEMKAWQKREDV